MLGFVEDEEVEFLGGEVVEIAVEEGVGGEGDVGVGELGESLMAVVALEDGDFEGRGEFSGLALPVFHDAGGGDDEVREGVSFFLLGEDVGEGLHGFAEAHVIGEDAV